MQKLILIRSDESKNSNTELELPSAIEPNVCFRLPLLFLNSPLPVFMETNDTTAKTDTPIPLLCFRVVAGLVGWAQTDPGH